MLDKLIEKNGVDLNLPLLGVPFTCCESISVKGKISDLNYIF